MRSPTPRFTTARAGTDAAQGNLRKALVSVAWAFSGRGLGVVWTAAMLAQLGLSDYGRYSIAWSVGALVALTIDNPFAVRAIRTDERSFVRERSTRILVGLTVAVVALVLYLVHAPYVVWFGTAIAGFEMLLAAVMSHATRMGDPQRLTKVAAVRQGLAVLLGMGVLLAVPGASLEQASLAYLVPYSVVIFWAIPLAARAVPATPGRVREIALLAFESLANALYIQGDILLLGVLADDRSTGMYALASTIAWAIAALGQSYGQTYHESLRANPEAANHGPSRGTTTVLAGAAGAVMLAVAAVMAFAHTDPALTEAVAIMAVFAALRVSNFVLTVILSVRGRDHARVIISSLGALMKLFAVGFLVWALPANAAAPAAAVGAVIAELSIYLALSRAATPPTVRPTP